MPSVLIESGYLRNPAEEDFLRSEQRQDEIADAIFKAFERYKQEVETN